MLLRKAIVSAICLLTASVGITQTQTARPAVADKIVAIVGDQIILSSEIQNLIRDITRENGTVPSNSRCEMIDQAIRSKLLMQQALKDSLLISDEEVDVEIDRRIGYLVNSQGSEIDDKTISQLKQQMRAPLKEYMLARAMQEKVQNAVSITPAEVKTFFDRIPVDSLPNLESRMKVGQIVSYPAGPLDLERYVISELTNYKKQVEANKMPFCKSEKLANQADCIEATVSRNDVRYYTSFLNEAFSLKPGQVSVPVKNKYGYYLIQMIDRKGDHATIRYIFRPNPVTDLDINQSKLQLNKLRSDIIDGRMSFDAAAASYSEKTGNGYDPIYFLNNQQSDELTIDELDREIGEVVSKMTVGEISTPRLFVDPMGIKGVRLIYLKSLTAAHRMNLRDDYAKIAQMALDRKKSITLDKWLRDKAPSFYIMIDDEISANCPEIRKFANAQAR